MNRYGYAGVGAFTVDLHPGTNTYFLRLERLPDIAEAPKLIASIREDRAPRLRLFQKQVWPVTIESSTNLRTWSFHRDAYYNQEFEPADLRSNVFYRAVKSP